MHNLDEYLSIKPPDLGDHCYLFDQYGLCPYGLACRFGSAHISANHENMTNKLLYDTHRTSAVRNVLGKELQVKLRKRSVTFPCSEDYMRQLSAGDGMGRTVDVSQGEEMKEEEGKRKEEDCVEKEEEGKKRDKDLMEEEQEGKEEEEEERKEDGAMDKEEIKEVEEDEVLGCQCTQLSSGSVTDEDLVRLTAREKKKV